MTLSTIMQSLQIINARVTYRNAPIHLLEKFTFKDALSAHKLLLEKAGLKECIILQTCNRVEVFAAAKSLDEQRLLEAWSSVIRLPTGEFAKAVEISKGNDVVLHLLKLASGLDSLVIGEDQVLGQIRRAFDFCRNNHYAGSHLSVIFDKAVKVGSKVRATTGINKGSTSVGSMAVNLAERYFNDLKNRNIILIGSGESTSLIAKSLKQRDVNFMVTSRTFDRAKSFADRVAGRPVPFEDAIAMLPQIDLIFVSTTAPYYLLTYDRIQVAMRNRSEGMMILDLSNPRTVEESVTAIKKVKLINMDQIAEIVEKNIRSRKKEILSAEKIIDLEMKSVDSILKRKKVDPVVVSVFKSVDAIREREFKKALTILGNKLGSEESRIIEQLSYAIAEGIISIPMNNLKTEIEIGDDEEKIMNVVARLFKYK